MFSEFRQRVGCAGLVLRKKWPRPKHSSKAQSVKESGDFLVVDIESGDRMEI
jgi:hypothetical protein